MIMPVDNIMPKADRLSVVSRAGLLSLLLMLVCSGCEAPSSTPGSRPGAVVPGRPGAPGAGLSSQPGRAGGAGTRSFSIKPGGAQATPVQTAAILAPAKSDSASPLLPAPEKPSSGLGMQPPNGSVVNPLGPTGKVEQAGNTVELASSIILAKANPFLDWLPKPLVPADPSVDATSAAGVTAPVADPFEKLALLGVVFHGKKAMALIGLGDSQNQFAEVGDLINLGAGVAKVVAVRTNAVDLQLAGKSASVRTLILPDIVGYAASSGSGAKEASASSAPSSNLSLLSPGGSTSDKTNSTLENLRKIFEQSSGGASPPSSSSATPQ